MMRGNISCIYVILHGREKRNGGKAPYPTWDCIRHQITAMSTQYSGHIEFADSENTKLISDAIKIYKDSRKFIAACTGICGDECQV